MDLDPSGNQHHRRRHFPPGFDDPPPGYSPSSEAPPLTVKLYVGKISIGATEDEIRGLFGEYGNVTEVVLMKSKRNGEPLDCCFVKYGTYEEADRAIRTLNGRYTFPGAFGIPLKVRYADNVGSIVQHKLYVCGLHRQATEAEIAQIFTPFGDVEEVFIIRGDMMQHRGCAFIQFTLREMAVAAINALNGSYTMWGCDLPLLVRFADPKKPRGGGSRTRITDQVSGFPNDSHINNPHSPNKRCKPQLPCVSNPLDSGFHSSSSSPYAPFPNEEPADSPDCDWSEHFCPDGYPYYYNCVTCESRWEKPEEYAVYERELLKSEHQHQHMPHPEALSTAVVAQF